jgi:hypothetical protein
VSARKVANLNKHSKKAGLLEQREWLLFAEVLGKPEWRSSVGVRSGRICPSG